MEEAKGIWNQFNFSRKYGMESLSFKAQRKMKILFACLYFLTGFVFAFSGTTILKKADNYLVTTMKAKFTNNVQSISYEFYSNAPTVKKSVAIQ